MQYAACTQCVNCSDYQPHSVSRHAQMSLLIATYCSQCPPPLSVLPLPRFFDIADIALGTKTCLVTYSTSLSSIHPSRTTKPCPSCAGVDLLGLALPAIPDAPYRGDVCALSPELSPYLRDVAINRPVRSVIVVAPDVLKQKIPAEGTTGMRSQER